MTQGLCRFVPDRIHPSPFPPGSVSRPVGVSTGVPTLVPHEDEERHGSQFSLSSKENWESNLGGALNRGDFGVSL